MLGFTPQHPPTVDGLIAASPHIDLHIAEQILYYAAKWSDGDPRKYLRIVNHLGSEIDTHGSDDWESVLWEGLLRLIQQVSSSIREKAETGQLRALDHPAIRTARGTGRLARR